MFSEKYVLDNVIIEYRNRPEGSESKLNTFTDGLKVISTIVRLYKDYKPFGFFSFLSVFFLLIGTVFFLPVFGDYINTGTVERFPTLIVCGFVVIMAMLLFTTGIILTTLRVRDRHDFEYRLQQIYILRKIFENLKCF